jgi:hypothetical protein
MGLDQNNSVGHHYVNFTPLSQGTAGAAITDGDYQREVMATAPTPADDVKTCIAVVVDDQDHEWRTHGGLRVCSSWHENVEQGQPERQAAGTS